ncbi:MAG: DNA translocase FtsK 4TM domain-containing protein [Opitutaceae bacterium]
MVRKAKKKVVKRTVVTQARKTQSRPICALLLFTLSVLLFVAIFDYNSGQYNVSPPSDHNMVGYFGSFTGFYGFHFFGVGIWLLPVFTLCMTLRCMVQQAPNQRLVVSLVSLGCLVATAGLAAMLFSPGLVSGSLFEEQLSNGFGGVLGEYLAIKTMEPYVGPFGTFMILFMSLIAGFATVFTNNLGRIVDSCGQIFRNFLEKRAQSSDEKKELKQAKAEEKRLAQIEQKRAKEAAKAEKIAAKQAAKGKSEEVGALEEVDDSANDGRKPSLLSGVPSASLSSKSSKTVPVEKPKRAAKVKVAESKPVEEALPEEPKKPKFDPSMIKVISGEKAEKAAVANIPERRGDYVFPPISLLAQPQDAATLVPEDHAGTMEALVRTLEEFGVKVIPGEIHTGPVITRYEVTPAPGVRVEKIVNLDKNIALGLKAMSVRILAPVPGKGTVGIEVPNKIAQAVCMRDIVESKAWADANAEIPIVLGQDVTGKPMVMDLTKMPHVLIAGSTGSGKTVCINAIIASLLYHSGPEDLRFIMVDPKVVEMQMYNVLPHMLIPVVTEAKKVPGALKWLIAEMENRYQIFAKTNVRNIAGFNAKIAKDKEEQAKAEAMDAEMSPEERAALSNMEVPRDDDAFEIPKKKLPYIVCVIDELADLMMVAPADIETCIARIAQLARAAGIHLVLATQRPSVNVVTGVIKANLPSRISFKVASKIDSRTILDGGGAEALIGKGDMLFIPPGTSNLVRAQGAFVSDDEINAIVEFLQEKNDPPVFAEDVQRQIDSDDDSAPTAGTGEQEGDELLPDAIDVLRNTKRASTSMLQRRLRIGYNRAARLMEELEDRGIVGPENGSSPREIMVDLDSM